MFEFKYNDLAKNALQQIKAKRYYERYLYTNKKIVLVGIAFNCDDKQVTVEHVVEVEALPF